PRRLDKSGIAHYSCCPEKRHRRAPRGFSHSGYGGLHMFERSRWPVLAVLLAGVGLVGVTPGRAQNAPGAIPQGIEVQARGPVHDAYASLAADPVAPNPIAKNPPAPIEEMPPAEKPEGDCIWISGYWAWDDDRSDFLWVSGVWRAVPPGKQWVAGYWR